MAANTQQGRYLSLFLTGFTGIVAGLVLWASGHAGIGIAITVVSIALLTYALVGFRKIKPLEFGIDIDSGKTDKRPGTLQHLAREGR